MICPKCGWEILQDKNFCEQCGFDARAITQQQNWLENDPLLIMMNNQYAKCGVMRLISGIAVALSVFLMYNALENNIADGFGEFGMVLFVPALIVFIVACILRGSMKKKIKRQLLVRTAVFQGRDDLEQRGNPTR
nr:zinc ribbon domain-containing protein [bacterium]